MKTRSTLFMMSLVLALPVGAWSATKAKSTAATAKTANRTTTTAVRSTSDDPIGEWIEKNGDRFGLYWDEPTAKTPTAKPTAPQRGVVAPRGGAVIMRTAETRTVNPSVDQVGVEAGESKVEKKVFTPPPAAVQTTDAAAQISAVMKDLEFSDRCDQFATPNGFGPWGRVIVEELVRGEGDALLRGSDDLRRACPNYDYLGVREKSYVWVKVIASMTFLESSCNPRAGLERVVKGPNGRAAGLLQLHKDKENQYGANCPKGASTSPTATLKCAISMLDRQLEKTEALFSRATYWGVLRPQGDVVKTKRGKRRVVLAKTVIGGLRELPLCRRK